MLMAKIMTAGSMKQVTTVQLHVAGCNALNIKAKQSNVWEWDEADRADLVERKFAIKKCACTK